MDIVRQAAQFGLQLWCNPYYGFLKDPTESEQGLIDELRAAFQATANNSVRKESDAAPLWERFQSRLRRLVLTKDPRGFLSWDVITRTMFHAFPSYAGKELIHLRRHRDWHSRWKSALQESRIGRPAPFPLYPSTSANLIHDAYNLCAFEEATGLAPEKFEYVLEFGGGYGSMCRLLFHLGFGGIYVIYDLPAFSSLQAYYLASLRIPLLTARSLLQGEKGVLLVSGQEDSLPSTDPVPGSKSLFIATWSISETSLDVRRRFLAYAAGCDAFLIAYQEQFGEMNNRKFFEDWQEETATAIEWRRIPIHHITGGHHYLFGTRKGATR